MRERYELKRLQSEIIEDKKVAPAPTGLVSQEAIQAMLAGKRKGRKKGEAHGESGK